MGRDQSRGLRGPFGREYRENGLERKAKVRVANSLVGDGVGSVARNIKNLHSWAKGEQALGKLDAIALRKHDVRNQEVRGGLLSDGDCFVGIGGIGHAVALALKVGFHHCAQGFLVLDKKNRLGAE
jgi:hypothetical protein